MSLFITSLNSGSNGNCYYIGNAEEAVFIDAGISCRETERRMRLLGLAMERVKAIFISHEHTDHISGLRGLSKKYRLPVYITQPTYRATGVAIPGELLYSFEANTPICIGGLSITAFPKFHDACDPHSFVISYNHIKVGIFTDIGHACPQVTHHFSQCHAAFLEANYDDGLLDGGRYPAHLKQRIRSRNGHLSNKQALQLFTRSKASFISHLLLSHLSAENNSPSLVADLFRPHAKRTKIVVASRHEPTPVYNITGSAVVQLALGFDG